MSERTSIAWTDASWSPLRARRRDNGKVGQHCERVSAGCLHCYAARHNGRNLPNGGTGLDYTRTSRDLVETFVDERVLEQPLRWRAPRRIFVCNQTDLFGDFYTDEQRDRVFAVMALASQHTFQVLTKRPERMRAWFAARHLLEPTDDPDQFPPLSTRDRVWSRMSAPDAEVQWPRPEWPLRNVWCGVSCEDQATADERIPLLLDTPAAVRFLSCEPLLGPVNLQVCPINQNDRAPRWPIDWVIVGGESGPKARPCEVSWIRSIVQQCTEYETPVFVKQDYGRYPGEQGRIPDELWVQEFPEVVA